MASGASSTTFDSETNTIVFVGTSLPTIFEWAGAAILNSFLSLLVLFLIFLLFFFHPSEQRVCNISHFCKCFVGEVSYQEAECHHTDWVFYEVPVENLEQPTGHKENHEKGQNPGKRWREESPEPSVFMPHELCHEVIHAFETEAASSKGSSKYCPDKSQKHKGTPVRALRGVPRERS